MRPHLRYALYVIRHKYFVFVAGRRVGVPLWRLIIHDYSKLSRAEWGPYVRRFGSGRGGVLDKTADPNDFHRAWMHHWHKNAHHWEHWLHLKGDGNFEPLEMSEHFALEMVADWMGAGRAITGRWDVREWYDQNAERIILGPETRALVEGMLR